MKQAEYESAELLHAMTIQQDIEFLRTFKVHRRMLSNFEMLLDMASKIVMAHSGDEQENAINELEEYLR